MLIVIDSLIFSSTIFVGLVLGISLHVNERKNRIIRGIAALVAAGCLYGVVDRFPNLIENNLIGFLFPLSVILLIVAIGACAVAGCYLLVRGMRGQTAIL